MRSKFLWGCFLCLSVILVSCKGYTAQDYVDDMKDLTKEVVDNASSYSADEWKEVAKKFQNITKKGEKVLKDMTKEEKKEYRKLKKELKKQTAKFKSKEFAKQWDEMLDEASDTLDELFNWLISFSFPR